MKVDSNSNAYFVGEVTFDVGMLATGVGGVKALKAAGWAGKLTIDGDHHAFPRLGGRYLAHVQLTVWKNGVKGSDKVLFRIALPLSRRFKAIRIIRF